MDAVVDLAEWRKRREAVQADPDGHPVFGADLARLERAVDRVHELVGVGTPNGRVSPAVETELLAILGELTIDQVRDAAARAEKLAARLAAGKGFSRFGGR